MIRRLNQFWSEHRGASLIELTILMPFLLVLGFGVFEYGKALYDYHRIMTGIRDAARYLARTEVIPGTPADFSATAKSNARDIAVYGRVGGTTPRVSWWTTLSDVVINAEQRKIDNAAGTYRGGAFIYVARVSTNVTGPGLGLLSALGFNAIFRVNVYQDERVIGE